MNKPVISALLLFLAFIPLYAAETPYDYNQKGNEALAAGEWYQAIDLFNHALDLNPNFKEPLAGLAESYFYLSEYEQALLYINKAIQLDRQSNEKKIFKARTLLALGDLENSEQLFHEVLASEPNNLSANYGIAELYIAYGRINEARTVFEDTLMVAPNNKRALISLTLLYHERNDMQKAQETIRTALYYHSRDPDVRYIAGLHYYLVNDLERAEEQLQIALNLDNANMEAAKLLAQIKLRKQEFIEAKQTMTNLDVNVQEDPFVRYTIALCDIALGDLLSGINGLAKIISSRPGVEIPQIILEELLLSDAELLAMYGPQYAEEHLASAESYIANFNKRYGQEQTRRALTLNPKSENARFELGGIYKQNGYLNMYLENLRILSQLNPESVYISDELEITASLQENSVSSEWDINQFSVNRDSVSLSVFYTSDGAKMQYFNSEVYLNAYFQKMLQGKDWLIASNSTYITSFSNAFKAARENETDYFLILSFAEYPRIFKIHADIYRTKNGVFLDSIEIQRTGNNRIFESFVQLTDRIAASMPVIGSILEVDNSMGLVNIGKLDGIEQGDTFPVIIKGGITLKSSEIGIDFSSDNVIGTATVIRTDDLISEVQLDPLGFYNLINSGDGLPLELKNTESVENRTPYELNSVLMQLFKL